MKKTAKYLILFLACTLAAGTLMAQTTKGDIQGRVDDDSGAPLPGVTVTVSSANIEQTAVTDTSGLYKFLALTPGTYTVKFDLSGFQSRRNDNIAVNIGSTTRVDAIMTSTFTDELVVTSVTPLVNTTSAGIGVDLSSDFYSDLPTGRNYTSVAGVTPGAQADGAGQTFYGSTGSENAYYIDGANTTGVELGQQGKTLNFEFIQEVQVKTGSYNAEYARATGSVINVITKSGGNEFHGDVFGYWDDASLQSNLSDEAQAGAVSGTFQTTSYNRSDFGADLGGYIVKDKLWFFAAYDRVDNEDNNESLKDFSSVIPGGTEEGQQFNVETTGDLWAAKLTWQIASNHSLSGSGFGDPTDQTGVLDGASVAATPLHFVGTTTTGGTDYSFNYDGVFTENFVISARIAQHNEESIVSGPGAAVEGYVDLTDPLGDGTTIWGWDDNVSGFGFHQNQEFSRDQYNIDLTYFVDGSTGSHEFKLGYEYEDIGVVNDNWNGGNGQRIYRYSCNPDYRDCQGEDYYYMHRVYLTSADLDPTQLTTADIQKPLSVDTKATNDGIYLQDTWQVLPNLTLDLGVRLGTQQLYNAFGEVSADIDDNIAPRVGFVWDFLNNGKSKAYAHWGYYFETIPMDIVIRSFGGEISIFSYNRTDDPNVIANDPTMRPARILGGGISRVDPNTQGQYIEEIVVGGEYEFLPDWAIGLKYISRDLPRIIEDALALDGDYFIGNPGQGEMEYTYTMAAAWGYNDAGPTEIVDPTRTFEGLELTLQKRFSNNFQFIASALWSTLEGNYDGTFQASTGQLDPNLNSAYDYADFAVNNNGRLSNDVRYQYKFDGIYRFNFGLTTGLSTYYRDGTPMTAMGYEPNYGNWELYLSERGVGFGRVDSQWEADLHFGYPIQLGSSLELNLLLDIFNVFNNQGETSRSLRYTNADETYDVLNWDTNIPYDPINVNADGRPPTNTAFNTANNWQDPTTIRLGVRLSF